MKTVISIISTGNLKNICGIERNRKQKERKRRKLSLLTEKIDERNKIQYKVMFPFATLKPYKLHIIVTII